MNRRKYCKIVTKLTCEGENVTVFFLLGISEFSKLLYFQDIANTQRFWKYNENSLRAFTLMVVFCLTCPYCGCIYAQLTNIFVEAPVDFVHPHSWITELISTKNRISTHMTNHSSFSSIPAPTLCIHIFCGVKEQI